MPDISLERFNDEFGFLTFPRGSNPTPDQILQSRERESSSPSGGLTPHPNLSPDKANTAQCAYINCCVSLHRLILSCYHTCYSVETGDSSSQPNMLYNVRYRVCTVYIILKQTLDKTENKQYRESSVDCLLPRYIGP